ncbi:NUDIX domain-containing protein [Subtercola frigoramans]
MPPALVGNRDSGDGWVEDGTGRRFWGRFGAAGLLAHDAERGILLQHRANWSHFGGTWGLPGGARHHDETSVQGAIREAHEEAGVPSEALTLRFTSTLDLGFWSYTTVVVDVVTPFDAVIADAESIEVRWVPIDEVSTLPLHPGFESAWPALRTGLERSTVLIVDAANVVGSKPDGWWNDRLGATERFATELAGLALQGFPAEALGITHGSEPGSEPGSEHGTKSGSERGSERGSSTWWPSILLVVEGQARGTVVGDPLHPGQAPADPDARPGAPAKAHDLATALSIVRAEADGDQTIVDTVERHLSPRLSPRLSPGSPGTPSHRVLVVTADRELRSRVESLGAAVRGPNWLWQLLESPAGHSTSG